ncbi:MAG: dihydrofolate reductase [Magnetospiraceae bacterium]
MRFSIIAAVAKNGVIGVNGDLPWRISEDLRFFKRTTLGKPLVMGRKTFDSLGQKPLPGRTSIVISRRPGPAQEHVTWVSSIAGALAAASGTAAADGATEVMIIGGGEIYRQALERADRLYITEVHRAYEGAVFFPAISAHEWAETQREDHDGDPPFSFVVFDRKTAA